VAAASCSLGPAVAFPAGRTSAGSVASGGQERTFQLYVPPSYDGTREMALVLNFHGLGSNGAEQQFYSGLVPVAEREGFLVASPDGINRAWLITPGVNDITFTRDLVAAIAEFACVDLDRVYATGMSNGGFMSAALACFAGDVVAAVAPVAGMTGTSELCGEPVPFIEFHGTEDRVVPYEPGILAPTGGSFAGVPVLMEAWAEFNGCAGDPREEEVGDSVVFREYQGCDVPTGHYVIDGGGHTWPGAIAVERLGATTQEISATEIAWAFFEANPRR
jgi:polyhydroxybutyrate depolymerase